MEPSHLHPPSLFLSLPKAADLASHCAIVQSRWLSMQGFLSFAFSLPSAFLGSLSPALCFCYLVNKTILSASKFNRPRSCWLSVSGTLHSLLFAGPVLHGLESRPWSLSLRHLSLLLLGTRVLSVCLTDCLSVPCSNSLSPSFLLPNFGRPPGRHHELFPCYFPALSSWPLNNWFPLGVWEEQSRTDQERTRTRGRPRTRGYLGGVKYRAGAKPTGGSRVASDPKEAIESASSQGAGRG